MTNEQMIKDTAEYYELPVEQVAMIWSVISWMHEEVRPVHIWLLVDGFIETKVCG